MREPKYYIVMDEYERGIIINSLNSLRNKLIADGKYTDVLDDILVKVAYAPIKKIQSEIQGGLIMEKSLFEQMGGRYEMQGDYLIPCLTLHPKKNSR